MDDSQQVAEYFDTVVERCNRDPSGRPNNLSKNDQIIYYVISTRCEIDMNGFASVFDQLLSEPELRFLIDGLHEIGAPKLAESFSQAHSRLRDAGFFDDDAMLISNLDEDAIKSLDAIEADVLHDDALWKLDTRLATLLPTNAE